MRKILLVAQHTRQQILQNRATKFLLLLVVALIIYGGITGLLQYKKAEESRTTYQKMVRDSWVNSPDKHPHRMAHYGFIAFRPKSALSIFDYGIESYTGNAVFLEAHRQNSTNFSEASLSSSLLRFGEISIAMVLQILLPLFIFFTGFNCIAQDRENGTLKILLTQGLSWKQLLAGKIIGLSSVAAIVFTAGILFTALLNSLNNAGGWTNFLFIIFVYSSSIFIYSSIAVIISATSKTSKLSLVALTGTWLLLIIALPKATQAVAGSLYPIPSKIAFENRIEQDIQKEGDSHNPDDKHYKALKDSVLKANNADSVSQLSFNYSGFQMAEGERISSSIYNKQHQQLLSLYKKQNRLFSYTGFISPYLGVKQLSMALCNTDFFTYTDFQAQAEAYRYALAQEMNALQVKLIPNKKLPDTAKNYTIDRKHWQEFSDFIYRKPALSQVAVHERTAIFSLIGWIVFLLIILSILSKKLKAI